MSDDRAKPPSRAPGGVPNAAPDARSAAVAAFLDQARRTPLMVPRGRRGRLVFAMDATQSREPAWDRACRVQAEMFQAVAAIGRLDIQLAWYRGFHEFHASPWVSDAQALLSEMTGVACHAGETQILRVLDHVAEENRQGKIDAVVFVGDCIEESVDALCGRAGALGLMGVPLFIFHEGGEPVARQGFEAMARLSRGAYSAFDADSARQLSELLRAVAVYAVGGIAALADHGRRAGGMALRLTHALGGTPGGRTSGDRSP
jgi:hypothetical protein